MSLSMTNLRMDDPRAWLPEAGAVAGANRGEEVVDEVVDGSASRVWVQAENRMHAARGLLIWLIEKHLGGKETI